MEKIALEQIPDKQIDYPRNTKAACCISVDFDAIRPGYPSRNHTGTSVLLDMSEKYSFPMTWAICGKTADNDRKAYESIVDSEIRHEIGVHTYSHIDVSRSTAETLENEITKCIDALDLDQEPKTFVFPFNCVDHLDVIRRRGFKVYRGRGKKIGIPGKDQYGLWNIRPTYHIEDRRNISPAMMRLLVDLTIANNSVLHLWFHPWDVVSYVKESRFRVNKLIEPTLSYLNSKREQNVLSILTMADLAEYWASR